jgi:site-specific recombinase XerD
VFSVAKVRCILGFIRRQHYRACLSTIYACGLRLPEGLHLQVAHIDSDRLWLHVCHGKGGKDRYVPLPKPILDLLRQYWVTHRNPVWLFPSSFQPGKNPMEATRIQRAFEAALHENGISKPATIHILRHSWATHLLEAGVNLRIIQEYLGHASPAIPAIYTHMTLLPLRAA